MAKLHRQVERTRDGLEKALIELINERGYESITIQEIVDRANVGRTTFYQHYGSKDELFFSCHKTMLDRFQLGPLYPMSREELLSLEAPNRLITVYRHLQEARSILQPVFQGKHTLQTLRRMFRDWNSEKIEASLQAAFVDVEHTVSIEMLANYLAGSHLALLQWWLEHRQPDTPERLAQTYHRLQRAAIREAFCLTEGC